MNELNGLDERVSNLIEGDWGTLEGDPSTQTPAIYFLQGEHIVGVKCLRVNRDDALTAIDIGARGLAPDTIVLCLDTLATRTPISPATGKPWTPGEMQQLRDAEDPRLEEVATDALIHIIANRRGRVDMVQREYSIQGDELVWGELRIDLDSGMTGLITQILSQSFLDGAANGSLVDHLMSFEGTLGAPPEELVRNYAYAATIRVILGVIPCVVGYGSRDPGLRTFLQRELSQDRLETFQEESGELYAILREGYEVAPW